MKRFAALASMALVASTSLVSWGADETPAPKRERPSREAMMKQMLEKFDADKDGKLSEEERTKARESMRGQGGPGGERFAELMKKFDKDGDGKLSEEERAALRAEMGANRPEGGRPEGRPNMEEIIKKFDKDGDGKLSEEERAAARASMPKRGPRGEGKGPGKPATEKPAEAKPE
ncbi:putative signal transduction protein with EFhand domain [Pirellula staleyi DSM 6068]|uniref:Putative signal transduction protein with EFhand domain n=1 Tax=Pirellula staleyi (strain ATCC 27377 / DSM 6068 / ICPB 4128) TaxID=530564 RepID=D2R0I5_PIRSD|nr:EF-hand domain-containing protein [Pirellula staleyi]ADB14853.1 putative signal transduction protein with EFhand domain [Pirellula staleyi DSM 6068]